jgi:hypothetical protein
MPDSQTEPVLKLAPIHKPDSAKPVFQLDFLQDMK